LTIDPDYRAGAPSDRQSLQPRQPSLPVDISEQPVSLARMSGASEETHGDCWRVQDLEQIDGFAGAVAASPGDWSLLQRGVRYEDAFSSLGASFPG